MQLDPQEHSKLIDDLGGPVKVVDIIRRRAAPPRLPTPQAVSNWRRRGIAFRWRATLALEAAEQGVGVPANFLNELPPPAGDDQVPFLR